MLFFFSGLHADYHKPSDTWDKIDAPDAAKLLRLVATWPNDLREAPERPQFVRVEPASHRYGRRSGGRRTRATARISASLPDFGEGIKGVKFADVREGSPAGQSRA